MARVRRLWFAVGISALAVFVGPPPPAHACSCAQQTEAEHFGYADAVFQGVVTGRSETGTMAFLWTIDVDRTEKGDVTDPQPVRSNRDGAACGYFFEVGTRYRVFATRDDDGSLSTNLCSGTSSVGGGAPPTSGAPTTTATRPPSTTSTRPTTTSTTPAGTTTSTSPTTTTTAPTTLAVAADAQRDGNGLLAVASALTVLGIGGAALLLRRLR